MWIADVDLPLLMLISLLGETCISVALEMTKEFRMTFTSYKPFL